MEPRRARPEPETARYLIVAAALLYCGVCASAEEMRVEVIPLQHRTAADVIPVVEPLVAAGGTVTGQHNQLIVRTTPANLEEIKYVLQSIDQRLRNLRITVRQGLSGQSDRRADALSARLRAGDFQARSGDPEPRAGASIGYRDGDNTVRYRTLSTQSQYDEHNEHFVQTVEGRPAFIHTGQSVPYASRSAVATPYGVAIEDSVDYQDVASGFYVVPRVQGDRVTLEIAPQLERLDPAGRGAIDVQHAQSTVSGRLGEWISLGGVTEDTRREDGVALTRTRRYARDLHDVSVRVEEIK